MPFTPTETEVTEAETARKAEYRKILNARRKREGIAEDAMKKTPEYASIYDAFFGRKLKP